MLAQSVTFDADRRGNAALGYRQEAAMSIDGAYAPGPSSRRASAQRARTTVLTFLQKLKESWISVLCFMIVGAIVALGQMATGVKQLLQLTEAEPGALELAHDNAKASFSRDLARSAWARIYWMKRYAQVAELGLPEDELNGIWTGYLQSLADWNENLMVNVISLETFYGADKRRQFEQNVQPAFGDLHACLIRIRFFPAYEQRGDSGCTFRSGEVGQLGHDNVALFNRKMNEMNTLLYCFYSGLNEAGEQCKVSRSDTTTPN